MGLFSKIKKTIKRADNTVTGGKIVQAVNNGGKAIAPLAQPVLVVAGTIVGGAAGATAGAAIGGVAGKALSGKSLKAGPEVELTLNVNVAGGDLPEADPSGIPADTGGASVNPDGSLQPPPPASGFNAFLKLLAGFLRNMTKVVGVDWIADPQPAIRQANSTTTTETGVPTSYQMGPSLPLDSLYLPKSAILRK